MATTIEVGHDSSPTKENTEMPTSPPNAFHFIRCASKAKSKLLDAIAYLYTLRISQSFFRVHSENLRAARPEGERVVSSRQAAPKPRLAQDEVEALEEAFRHNPKPSSAQKRKFTEQMGVEVPRINVRCSIFINFTPHIGVRLQPWLTI